MGKKYDAYEMAAKAENDAKARALIEPTKENQTNAEQAEINSNVVFSEFLDDPEN